MNRLTSLVFTIILLLFSAGTDAAERLSIPEETDERVLKLTHIKTGDTVIIRSNDFIQFKYKGQKIKGEIDSIAKKTIYLKGKEYEIDELNALKTEFSKRRLKKKGNISMITGVIAFLGVEIWKNIYRFNNSNFVYNDFMFIWLQSATVIFIILPGLLFRIIDFTYRYDLRRRWKVESIRKSQINAKI